MDQRPPLPVENFNDFSDYKPSLQEYVAGVLSYTMAVGVGLAILACIIFNCALLVNCCRRPNSACGCCRPRDYKGPHEKCCGKECCPQKTGTHYPSPDDIYQQPGHALFAADGTAVNAEPTFYKVKHTRFLFALIFIVLLAHLVFSGVVYQYGTTTDEATLSSIDGTVDLLSGFANLICNDNDPDAGCDTSDSIGGFLEVVSTQVNTTFDDCILIADSIQGISGSIVDFSNALVDASTDADDVTTLLTDTNNDLNTQCSDYDTDYTYVSNPAHYGGAQIASLFLMGATYEAMPCPTATDIGLMTGISQALDDASTATNDISDAMDNGVNDALTSIEDEIGPSGNTRVSIQSSLNDFHGSMVDVSNDLIDMHSDIDGTSAEVKPYLVLKTQAFTAISFLPAILLLYHTLGEVFCGCKACNACCYKGVGGCLRCHNCFQYFGNWIWCIIAGIAMLLSVVVYDTCDNFEPMILVNLNMTQNVFDNEINFGTTAVDILHCGTNENIVDILGLGQSFNFTEDVSSVLTGIDDASSSLFTAADSAADALTQVVDALNDALQLSVTSANVTAIETQIQTALDILPDAVTVGATCTLAAATDISTLIAFYDLHGGNNDGTGSAFGATATGLSRISYTCTEDYCVQCDAGANANTPSTPPSCTVSAYDAVSVYFRYSTTVVTYNSGSGICDAVVDNNNARDTLDSLLAESTAIAADVVPVDQFIVTMAALNQTSNWIHTNITSSQDRVTGEGSDTLHGAVQGLLDVIMTAPDYTDCGFIGSWYSDTFEGSFCTDANNGMQSFSVALTLNAVLMIVLFLLLSWYTPFMRLTQTLNAPTDQIDLLADNKDGAIPMNYVVAIGPGVGATTLEMASRQHVQVRNERAV